MVMSKAFQDIFFNAFNRVDNSINFSESITELNQITSKDYKETFILELMKFFEKEYSVDLLTLYSEYMKKCAHSWVFRFSQLCESEEGL